MYQAYLSWVGAGRKEKGGRRKEKKKKTLKLFDASLAHVTDPIGRTSWYNGSSRPFRKDPNIWSIYHGIALARYAGCGTLALKESRGVAPNSPLPLPPTPWSIGLFELEIPVKIL